MRRWCVSECVCCVLFLFVFLFLGTAVEKPASFLSPLTLFVCHKVIRPRPDIHYHSPAQITVASYQRFRVPENKRGFLKNRLVQALLFFKKTTLVAFRQSELPVSFKWILRISLQVSNSRRENSASGDTPKQAAI